MFMLSLSRCGGRVAVVPVQVRFEDDVTDDLVAAEEFVDEEDYFQFITGFRTQVIDCQDVAAVVC